MHFLKKSAHLSRNSMKIYKYKTKLKISAFLLLLFLLFMPYKNAELATKTNTVNTGDYVFFGKYNNEKIVWRVINKK